MDDRFAIDDLAGHDLPDGTVVARNRRTGAQMPLPGEVFNAISHCDAFRTMDEQIAHLAGPNARGREGEIRKILQSVIDGGLMLSAARIAAQLEPRESKANPESAVGAIITCDRPEALSRLLRSIEENCDPARLDALWVIDDSRNKESRAANRNAIESMDSGIVSGGSGAVRHFAPDDAKSLCDALAKRLPEHADAVRFLLDRQGRKDHVTTGISRNLAQLLAAGRTHVVFDDDVLCQAMAPPESQSGVEFSAVQRPCHFYASRNDWQEYADSEQPCPVTRHLQVLGSDLAGALDTLGQPAPTPNAFEFTTPGFAGRLSADSRILISQSGTYGDPGSGGNEWVALLPAEARAELSAIAGDPRNSKVERHCWLGRTRPAFEPRANMSQLTGIDNREYLPPYFPLFRGQDRAFGAMTEFIHPQSLAADLPFALPHLPVPPRTWAECPHGFSLPFSISQFLNDFVTGEVRHCGATDPLARNAWLAMLYADLAESPRDRIVELTAGHWTQQRIDWLTKLSEALAPSDGQPAALADYLQQLVHELQASGARDFTAVEFRGPPDDLRGDPVLEWWREGWRNFSAGIRAWPQIREAARDIVTD